MLFQFLHIFIDALASLRITYVIRIHIRLGQYGIVYRNLGIKANATDWRKKTPVGLILSSVNIVGHKAAKTRHYDTIVAQK